MSLPQDALGGSGNLQRVELDSPSAFDGTRLVPPGTLPQRGPGERWGGADAVGYDCYQLTNTCEIPYYQLFVPGVVGADTLTRLAEGFNIGDIPLAESCTLKTVWITFYAWDDPGSIVDVDVAICTDDGSGFPGVELARVTIPAAVVDANLFTWLSVDFSAFGITGGSGDRFHVVIDVPMALPSLNGVSLIMDGGTDDPVNCPKGAANTNGSVYSKHDGVWKSHMDVFGIQFGAFIVVDWCCETCDYLCQTCTPAADAHWETQGNGIGRTNATTDSLASLCGLTQVWTAEPGGYVQGIQPVIAGNYVLVTATDSLHCYDKATGGQVWSFGSFPYILGDIRGAPTVDVDSGWVYVGGGAAQSFNCVNLTNGGLRWSRNVTTTPLPTGATSWTSSIVSGGYVYFTQETGYVHKLTMTIGSNMGGSPLLLPDAGEGKVPLNGLASNGTKLWVGTADAVGTNGNIHQIDMATMTVDWTLHNPSYLFTGDADYYEPEGFPGSLAYDDGILYYHSLVRDDAAGFSHYPQTGALGAIDVSIENGTGNGVLWVNPVATSPVASPGITPSSYNYSGPTVGAELIYTAARGLFAGTEEPDGIAAYDRLTGVRVWYYGYTDIGELTGVRVLDDVRSDVPATLFCQTDGSTYLFTSHNDGNWRLLDALTGEVVWRRAFTGRQRGTAVAGGVVVTTTRSGGPHTGGGSVTLFAPGADRPRLQIDSQYIYQQIPSGSGVGWDTVFAAFRNTGCVTLNISGYTVSESESAVRVSSVHPLLSHEADEITRALRGYESFLNAASAKAEAIERWGAARDADGDSLARHFAAEATAAAAAPFLTWGDGPPTLAPGEAGWLLFGYDPTGLYEGVSYVNYLEFVTDDPDFYPQDPSGSVLGNPYVVYNLFVGCPEDTATLLLGAGEEWICNYGALLDPVTGQGFRVNGNNWHFDGSLWAVATDNSKWAIEGVSVGTPPRRPTEFGTREPCGVAITDGSAWNPLGGTDAYKEATNNIIDQGSSSGFFAQGSRQLGGMVMEVQRVGSQDAAFGDFGLARVKVTNEADGNGAMVNLYIGVAEDWDIDPYGSNNTHLYYADAYYACDNGGAAGRGDATSAAGNARLDALAVGTSAMGSGGAPTFHMGDFFGDQGLTEPFSIASAPYAYIPTFHTGDQVQNTDVGVYYSMLHVPLLAEDASAEFVYCTWQLDNGVNGLPWSDSLSYDAAVAEIVGRARAYAGFGKGDLNADGTIDSLDLAVLDSILHCLITPGGALIYTADVDADNRYSWDDYDLLRAVVLGSLPESALANAWRFDGASACGVSAEPRLTWPVSGDTVEAATAVCQWEEVCDAVSYQFQADTSFAFATPLVDTSLTATECMLSGLSGGYTRYWRVKATNACGPSAWETTDFQVRILCPIDVTGDVNVDGVITSADIIALVAYVYKGGAPPLPCEAAGDANCSGSVTSADIIYLVTHVFKGGDPPCDVCTLIPGTWTCP